MEQGNLSRDEFMGGIIHFTEDIVNRAKTYTAELKNKVFPDLIATCPNCQARQTQNHRRHLRVLQSRVWFQNEQAHRLQTHQRERRRTIYSRTKVHRTALEDFKSRFNRPFDAALELKQEVSKTGKKGKWKVSFVFDDGENERDELTEDQVIATVTTPAPVPRSKFTKPPRAWYVPAITTKDSPDGIRISRTILQCEIPSDQGIQLIEKGKTNLLPGFHLQAHQARLRRLPHLRPGQW